MLFKDRVCRFSIIRHIIDKVYVLILYFISMYFCLPTTLVLGARQAHQQTRLGTV